VDGSDRGLVGDERLRQCCGTEEDHESSTVRIEK